MMPDANTINERIARIEDSLLLLLTERVAKEYYSTTDVAKILGKAEFTVREWCRNYRIQAEGLLRWK